MLAAADTSFAGVPFIFPSKNIFRIISKMSSPWCVKGDLVEAEFIGDAV
jgi:hypothetical protein